MSVIIVDDSEISAKILEVNLNKKGFETLCARNGIEALELFKSRGAVQAVITDVVMPKMDGLELLERIRCEPYLMDMPVILCSSDPEAQSVRRAAEIGCKHFLVKPMEPQLLLQRLAEAIKESKPIISSPKEVMNRFSLEMEPFEEIKSKFQSLLWDAANMLKNSEGAPTSDLKILIPRLLEAAVLSGAQRLA